MCKRSTFDTVQRRFPVLTLVSGRPSMLEERCHGWELYHRTRLRKGRNSVSITSPEMTLHSTVGRKRLPSFLKSTLTHFLKRPAFRNVVTNDECRST